MDSSTERRSSDTYHSTVSEHEHTVMEGSTRPKTLLGQLSRRESSLKGQWSRKRWMKVLGKGEVKPTNVHVEALEDRLAASKISSSNVARDKVVQLGPMAKGQGDAQDLVGQDACVASPPSGQDTFAHSAEDLHSNSPSSLESPSSSKRQSAPASFSHTPSGSVSSFWDRQSSTSVSSHTEYNFSRATSDDEHFQGDALTKQQEAHEQNETLSIFETLDKDTLQIDLSHQNLTTVPIALQSYERLLALDLSYNLLFADTKTWPSWLGPSLSTLETLNLKATGMSAIPPALLQMKNLRVLDLSSNALSVLPLWLHEIKTLEHFGFSDNPIKKEMLDGLQAVWEKSERSRVERQDVGMPSSTLTRRPTRLQRSISILQRRSRSDLSAQEVEAIPKRPKSIRRGPYQGRLTGIVEKEVVRISDAFGSQDRKLARRATKLVLSYLQDLDDLSENQIRGCDWSKSSDGELPALEGRYEPTKAYKILREIVETERTYVGCLEELVKIYVLPAQKALLTKPSTMKAYTLIPEREQRQVWGWANGILALHRDHVLPKFEKAAKKWDGANARVKIATDGLARSLLDLVPFMKIYESYAATYEVTLAMVTKWHSDVAISTWLDDKRNEKSHSQLNLQGYLLLPIQRLPRYRMLFADLAAKLGSGPYSPMANAVLAISNLVDWINEKKREHEGRLQLSQLQKRLAPSSAPIFNPSRYLIATSDSMTLEKAAHLHDQDRAIIVYDEVPASSSSILLVLCNDALLALEPDLPASAATPAPAPAPAPGSTSTLTVLSIIPLEELKKWAEVEGLYRLVTQDKLWVLRASTTSSSSSIMSNFSHHLDRLCSRCRSST